MATIAEDAKNALDEFEKANTDLAGKAYLTSGDRSISEQIDIIFDPKRADNYTQIKERFKSKYILTALPARADLNAEQLAWWEVEVKAQAGLPTGFAHVGGKAQDISVKNLDTAAKTKLKEKLEAKNISIYMEKVTGTTSEYGVSTEQANVFHVYYTKAP